MESKVRGSGHKQVNQLDGLQMGKAESVRSGSPTMQPTQADAMEKSYGS